MSMRHYIQGGSIKSEAMKIRRESFIFSIYFPSPAIAKRIYIPSASIVAATSEKMDVVEGMTLAIREVGGQEPHAGPPVSHLNATFHR